MSLLAGPLWRCAYNWHKRGRAVSQYLAKCVKKLFNRDTTRMPFVLYYYNYYYNNYYYYYCYYYYYSYYYYNYHYYYHYY